MGWSYHYGHHYYKVPSNGACFGPQELDDYVGIQHFTKFLLDENRYRLGHLFREPGNRVTYKYDLQHEWLHDIELVEIIRRGDTLGPAGLSVACNRSRVLAAGALVEIKGLKSAEHYNGSVAKVHRYNIKANRWVVALKEDITKMIKIK